MGDIYLAFELDFLFILYVSESGAPTKEEGGGEGLTLYGAYHFARRVFPLVHVSRS